MIDIIILVVTLSAGLGIALYLYWPKLVFSPIYYEERDAFHAHPERFRPLEVVRQQNVVLEGIVYEPASPECTVLYFGGREQDSVALVGKMSEWFPSWRIAAFNYRGYGLSRGEPTEANLLEDAVFLADDIKARYGEIVIMGYSLGASVAAYAASRTAVRHLVLVAPFFNIPSLVRARGVVLPAFMMRCRFDTARYLGGVSAPVTIFAGSGDTLVPVRQSRALRERAHRLVLYKEYSGYNHAEILGSDAFIADVQKVC